MTTPVDKMTPRPARQHDHVLSGWSAAMLFGLLVYLLALTVWIAVMG